MCALMQPLQQPLNTLLAFLITKISPAILLCQRTANRNSTTVNNECFFRSCSIHWSYKGIYGNWVIPTPSTVLNTSCPWLNQPFQPWALAGDTARDIPAGNLELCWELLHCRNQTPICAESKSAPHHKKMARLLALQQSVCTGNIYWPIHTIDDTINGNLVPAKTHVIDPTSLVWRVFYKLRAKCCDLTDELQ